MKDKTLYSLYYALNENVILASQFTSMYVELVFPYSVSINFSIINKDDDCLFNNLAVLEDYIAIIVRIYFYILFRNYHVIILDTIIYLR